MYQLIACDLDGVVWRGSEPIVGSADAIRRLRAAGSRVVFVTNNSSTTPTEYVKKLSGFGIETLEDDVVTSALAAALHLTTLLPGGSRVLAVSGTGVVNALEQEGFQVVEPIAKPALRGLRPRATGQTAQEFVHAVVVGWHTHFDFERMRVAADAIRGGALFIATNDDPTYPGAGSSVLPGNGSIVSAIATASGVVPVVAGKPNAPMAAFVQARYGKDGLMIGDRISTDGEFAVRMGWPFAHVRSGIEETIEILQNTRCVASIVGQDLVEIVSQLLR